MVPDRQYQRLDSGSPNNAALGASPGHLPLVDGDQVAQFARIDGARS
jgi:hypothetical protein